MMDHHDLLHALNASAGVISRNGGFGGLHPRQRGNLSPLPNDDKADLFLVRPKSTDRSGSVLKDLNLFKGDQTARHHSIQRWQESVDLFLAVDDLDHERQIFREAQ